MREVKNGYKVSPLGNVDIIAQALGLRKLLKLEDAEYINVAAILEIYGMTGKMLNYEYCEDKHVRSQGEGFYDPKEKKILIPDSVYCLACDGDGQSRFTFGHEIGHWWLDHSVTFARGEPPKKIYENSEWQADRFSSCFLAPPHMVIKYDNPEIVAKRFGLSMQAAKFAFENAKKAKRSA